MIHEMWEMRNPPSSGSWHQEELKRGRSRRSRNRRNPDEKAQDCGTVDIRENSMVENKKNKNNGSIF